MNSEFKVIPAIDILKGQLVRLKQGEYDQVSTYMKSPVDMAKFYEENGAKRIHIVDLDGAKEGKLVNLEQIKAIREATQCELEIGGGVRDIETANALFDMGVELLIIGSLIIKQPEEAANLIQRFPQKMIAGVDAREGKVATVGWTETSGTSTKQLFRQLNELPLAGIIFTDIARDGMLTGPNLEELESLSSETKHPIYASGGVRNIADIQDLKALSSKGVNGCIIGKAILDGRLDISKALNT